MKISPFEGFPSGKIQTTPIPSQFFTEFLPQIKNLNELKVCLYAFYFLDHQEGEIRFLISEDFSDDERLMNSLGDNREESLTNLACALNEAVEHGFLIFADIEVDEFVSTYYFLNSALGRNAVEALKQNKWSPDDIAHISIKLEPERPNIFRLYEENIGPLTPLIAETLDDAEKNYSAEWIEKAIQIAVERNARNWRYIEAILKSWQEEGRNGTNRRDVEENRRRYLKGEFSDFIEH